jgi:hypothetical protein
VLKIENCNRITEDNKKSVLDFKDYLLSEGVGYAKIYKIPVSLNYKVDSIELQIWGTPILDLANRKNGKIDHYFATLDKKVAFDYSLRIGGYGLLFGPRGRILIEKEKIFGNNKNSLDLIKKGKAVISLDNLTRFELIQFSNHRTTHFRSPKSARIK